MGVHGLTSYVAKNSSLHTTLTLPQLANDGAAQPQEQLRRPFVVDGMAFLYHVGLQDTLRGGNYAALRENVRRYVEYWRLCGLEPEFVWDGPFDTSKIATVVQRSAQSLKKSLTYMRTSDAKRESQPALAAAAARLPMLSQTACIAELRALGCEVRYAEAEADSPTAELASRRGPGALVASNDSDYFIFPTTASYVPLQRIGYGPDRLPRLESVDPSLPPSLHLQLHHHTSIAASLSIPPSHLPVFAALIGNDQHSFPELLAPQRSTSYVGQVSKTDTLRVARALAKVNASLNINEAIAAVVPALLSKPSRNPNLIPSLISSAHSYALQPLSHPSPSFPLHPRPEDTLPQSLCRALYLDAFRLGRLANFTLSIMKHRQVTPGGAVEVPEFQSPSISVGRPLRLWVYAIIEEGIGFGGASSIIEHVRRQEELHAAHVGIPKLQDLLDKEGAGVLPSPIILASPPERLSLLLIALRWPHSLPPAPLDHFLPLVLALGHIQHQLYSKRPWSRTELLAALTTAVLLHHGLTLSSADYVLRVAPPRSSIQRSVELVQALFYIRVLSEVLLVTEEVTAPHELFDGAMFHALLDVGERWETVEKGLPSAVRVVVRQLEDMVVN